MRWRVIPFYAISIVCLVLGLIFDSEIVNYLAGSRVEFLNSVMTVISSGTWIIGFMILFTYLLLREADRRGWVFPLWISFVLSLSFVYILKYAIMRPRPSVALAGVSAIGSSFPSTHAAAVFCIFAILNAIYTEFPKLNWIWLLGSLMIVFSRIYLGLHYLSDIAVGAALGYTVSLIVATYGHKKNKRMRK